MSNGYIQQYGMPQPQQQLPGQAVLPAYEAYRNYKAIKQSQQPQTDKNNNKYYTSNIKTDMMFGAGMGAGFSLFEPAKGKTFSRRQLFRAKNLGANLLTGGASAVPMSIVNSATADVGNRLADSYSKTDSKVNPAHLAMVAAPGVVGGVYSLGAIMHGMNKAKDVMKAKTLTEKGKHILDSANPLKHWRTGVQETKDSFKKLFTFKKGVGKFMPLLNVLGIAASTVPAIYKYVSGIKKKKEQQQNLINPNIANKLGYADDIFNGITTATTKVPPKLVKSAAYIPVFTNLLRARDSFNEIKHLSSLGKKGLDTSAEIEKKWGEVRKHLRNAGYDALGTGVLGTGAYMYWKKKQNEKNNFRTYL